VRPILRLRFRVATYSRVTGNTEVVPRPKSAWRKSHQRGTERRPYVHEWSSSRLVGPTGSNPPRAVTTTVNSLLSNCSPFFFPFPFASAQSYASSDPPRSQTRSMSQNDLKLFREHGCDLPAKTAHVRAHEYAIFNKPFGACGCPPRCASRLKSQLAVATIVRANRLSCWSGATGHRRSRRPHTRL